jgi:hypothetical protein
LGVGPGAETARATPKAGDLLALSKQKKYPASVIPKLPAGDLQGSACSQYGQNGTVDVQYVPDVNFSNGFTARTMIAVECLGVVPPDSHEVNDTPDTPTEIQASDNDGGTISPAGDVDWYRFDMTQLCDGAPELCSTGMQIGLQSTGDAVTLDGYDAEPPTSAVVDDVTFWEHRGDRHGHDPLPLDLG